MARLDPISLDARRRGVKHKSFLIPSAANLVAAVTGARILLVALIISHPEGAATGGETYVTLRNGSGGTNLIDRLFWQANVIVLPYNEVGWCKTSVSTALWLQRTANVTSPPSTPIGVMGGVAVYYEENP